MPDDIIANLPKGALPDPIDERDYKITPEILGAVTVDWSKEFRLPDPGNEDQGSSDSCVSQAWSYYHRQLHGKDYSRRDLFCRIALPYGAYIRDGGKEIVGSGQATRDEVADPRPQTAQNMRSTAGTKPEYRTDDKELNYFVLPQQDINGVAWGIQNYKGVVFGVTGSNSGWRDMKYPKPPMWGEETWGHALYAMGFHICKDGQKCIIAKSSWCNVVTEHHIRENYFITGNTFNAWTLIPREEIFMTNSLLVKKEGEYGFYDPATSGDGLITMMRNRGINPPLKEDGTLDWAKVEQMVKGNVV
jgi:hypothetical protein